jgi:hypothetical protein
MPEEKLCQTLDVRLKSEIPFLITLSELVERNCDIDQHNDNRVNCPGTIVSDHYDTRFGIGGNRRGSRGVCIVEKVAGLFRFHF